MSHISPNAILTPNVVTPQVLFQHSVMSYQVLFHHFHHVTPHVVFQHMSYAIPTFCYSSIYELWWKSFHINQVFFDTPCFKKSVKSYFLKSTIQFLKKFSKHMDLEIFWNTECQKNLDVCEVTFTRICYSSTPACKYHVNLHVLFQHSLFITQMLFHHLHVNPDFLSVAIPTLLVCYSTTDWITPVWKCYNST